MALQRTKYEVAYSVAGAGDKAEEIVTVVHADKVRAEREARQRAIPPVSAATAMEYSSLWVWAALKRLGKYEHDYTTFVNRDLVDLEPLEDEDGEPAVEQVDPTRPAAPTGSPSSSPATSADSSTG